MDQDTSALRSWLSPLERIVGWLLLAVGLWMRVSFPDWIEFREDEAYALAEARRALEEGGLAHGLRGSHFNVMPPAFPLLFVPVVAWKLDPVAASAWVVLWNLAALAALFLLLRRAFGERLAVLATALFASLPLATVYARKAWQPDMIVPFVFPLLLALLALAERWRRPVWIAAVVLYALACQVHASVWFLAPALLVFLVLARIRPPLLDLAIGAAAVLALYASYLGYEMRTGFDDLAFVLHARPETKASLARAAMQLVRQLENSLEITAPHVETIVGSARAALLQADPLATFPRIATAVFRVLCGAATLASLASSAALLLRTGFRGPWTPAERVRLLFGLAFAITLLAFVVGRIPPVPHYHVVLFPCVAFFAVDALAKLLRGRAAALLVPAVGALVVGHAMLWLSIRRVAAETPELGGGAFRPLTPDEFAMCRRDLPGYIDTALHKEQRWREQQARLAARFEASARVLLSMDARRNEPPATTRDRGSASPGPEGLTVTGTDRLYLPPFEEDATRPAILRLELSLRQQVRPIVYRLEPDTETFKAARAISTWVPAGREVLHVDLRHGGGGALMLVLRSHRWVLHACEVRAVEGG